MLRILLTSAVLATCAVAQSPTPIQRANGLIQQQRFTEAIPILDSLIAAQPNLPIGWALLGAAHLGVRQLDQAVAALERAITFPNVRPNALYNLGLALYLGGRTDEGIARMREARATNRVDMTWLLADTDAVTMRGDPRFADLVPTAAEYAAPFVEPVTILREWVGEAGGDQFGWIARNLGDVDGDGIADVITSAPSASNNTGAVYALSSGRGTVLWTVRGTQPGEQLGLGVEAAGDVNGDGVPDAVAGAPNAGYVVVLSGRDGAELRRWTAREGGEHFGRRVAGAGDWNQDGFADVLISAPLNDAGGQDAGRVYLVSGRDGADLHVWTGPNAGARLGDALDGAPGFAVLGAPGTPGGGSTRVFRAMSDEPAFIVQPDSTAASLGFMFVSVVGDLDADGTADVYASDWANRANGPGSGRIYAHSGATGARLHTLSGEGPGHGFGIGVAKAGDVNRDGHDDLIVGAWQFNAAAAAGGKLYLHSGRDGALLGVVTGRVMGETLGFDATGIGDVNGDGVPDLLVTSAWSAKNGYRSGRTIILSGADVLQR